MQLLETWLPLVVVMRDGQVGAGELKRLADAFERRFQRGRSYAVLTVTHRDAEALDALGRMRIAQWANHPRVRRCSRELCVGSASVTARDAERRALIALRWLWTPAVPHRAVATVAEGLEYCIAQLTEAQVRLPSAAEAFRRNVYQSLCALPINGIERASAGPVAQPGAHLHAPAFRARVTRPAPARSR